MEEKDIFNTIFGIQDEITEEEFKKRRYSKYNFNDGSGDGEARPQPDAELELLKVKVTEQDIQFVIDTIIKEAKHDRISIKQIFVGMCGGIGNIAIHHNVNSKNTGAGKSYLLILVSEYFPSKYILMLMGVSDKAFQHREGMMVLKDPITNELTPTEPMITSLNLNIAQLEHEIQDEKAKDTKMRNKGLIKDIGKKIVDLQAERKSILERQQKLIDLNNSIVILLDTPQDSFYAGLMSLLSSDTAGDQIYMFTDKLASGKLASKENIIRGSPAMFATRTIDDTRNQRFEETNRRFINVTPSVTPEKIRDANSLIWQRYGLTTEEYDETVVSTEDKKRAKHIVAVLCAKSKNHGKYFKAKQASVRIPFLYSIETPYNSEWAMTVNGRMVRYLTIITKIHMDNRPRLVRKDNPNIFYPISRFADLKETLELMERAGSNVRSYLAQWYNEKFLPTFNAECGQVRTRVENIGEKSERTLTEDYVAVTSKQLCEITSVSNEVLRHKYIDPLVNQGLINKARSNIRKNENIYFPVDAKGENIYSLFRGRDRDFRLHVKNPSLYPSKNFLIDSFRKTGIFGKMFGDNNPTNFKKNIFDTYRLEDENRLEISLDELVERYLSDPETCFIEDYEHDHEYDKGAVDVANSNNNYAKMVLLNSILPRICEEKNFKNTPTLVAEDSAEHFSNSGQIGDKPILSKWIHESPSDTSDTSESKNKSNNSTGNRNE
jgi:hypothetical protein